MSSGLPHAAHQQRFRLQEMMDLHIEPSSAAIRLVDLTFHAAALCEVKVKQFDVLVFLQAKRCTL